MATSKFCRSMKRKFRARQDTYRMLRADWDRIVGSEEPGNWRLAGAVGPGTVEFVTLVERGACALPDKGVTDPLIAWLEELRLTSRHFKSERSGFEQNVDGSGVLQHQAGTIWNAFEASADRWSELEGKALEAENFSVEMALARSKLLEMELFLGAAKSESAQRVTSAVGGTEPPKPLDDTRGRGSKKKYKSDEPGYPVRAAWLKERLGERRWNIHDVSRQGGPDHKTVQRILDSRKVQEDVLDKLATALSTARKQPPVSVIDIPRS